MDGALRLPARHPTGPASPPSPNRSGACWQAPRTTCSGVSTVEYATLIGSSVGRTCGGARGRVSPDHSPATSSARRRPTPRRTTRTAPTTRAPTHVKDVLVQLLLQATDAASDLADGALLLRGPLHQAEPEHVERGQPAVKPDLRLHDCVARVRRCNGGSGDVGGDDSHNDRAARALAAAARRRAPRAHPHRRSW